MLSSIIIDRPYVTLRLTVLRYSRSSGQKLGPYLEIFGIHWGTPQKRTSNVRDRYSIMQNITPIGSTVAERSDLEGKKLEKI